MVYLDCNATTPVVPSVREIVRRYVEEEYGNAGSRTHEFGQVAKKAVQLARAQVAALVDVGPEEVIFTSGATEASNLAHFGLAQHGLATGRTHIVTTQIEHKAVLEPIAVLEKRGFSVTRVAPNEGGWVEPEAIAEALQPETLLVSVMQVNNETGVVQPIEDIADALSESEAYFHVDAAQGFGKRIADLSHRRIDLISVSAHKLYAPKGVGALITRRRGFQPPPLEPIIYGGGQERGLRPGTLPVPLIAGFGEACRLASIEQAEREAANRRFKDRLLAELSGLALRINGDPERTVAHTLNFSIDGLDSEAAMLALKGVVAVSNGSACTSRRYEPSHVLEAMGLSKKRLQGALRFSWSHLTPDPDWDQLATRLARISQ